MRALTQVYDLSDLPGITGYVQGLLQPDIQAAFAKNGGINPFGVALGEVTNGTKLPRPQPMIVGGGTDVRVAKRMLRKMVLNSHAKGAIFCHPTYDPDAIVIQLEHQVHGDLVWSARIVADKLGAFSEGQPLADCALEAVKQTSFMRQRYMQ